jgi:RNA polymerase sigma-70 factor (ECF subfamily)
LQPTALVHEAYVRLFKSGSVDWQGRVHFFAVAAQIMRRILIDKARGRRAAKRGGGWQRISVEDTMLQGSGGQLDIIILDAALDRLQTMAPRPSRVVEMVFFGGMTMGDAALVLGVSEKTVKRDWATAKAWLYKEIYGSTDAMGQGQ